MLPEDVKEVEKYANIIATEALSLRKAAIALQTAEDWITREPLSDRAKRQHLEASATYVAAKIELDNSLGRSCLSLKNGVIEWVHNARKWTMLPRTKALNLLENIAMSH